PENPPAAQFSDYLVSQIFRSVADSFHPQLRMLRLFVFPQPMVASFRIEALGVALDTSLERRVDQYCDELLSSMPRCALGPSFLLRLREKYQCSLDKLPPAALQITAISQPHHPCMMPLGVGLGARRAHL